MVDEELDSSNFQQTDDKPSLKIKLNLASMTATRRSTRSSAASGSEYRGSEKSVDMDHVPNESPPVEDDKTPYTTKKGRKTNYRNFVESSEGEDDNSSAANLFNNKARVTRASSKRHSPDEDDEGNVPRRSRRKANHLDGFIVFDEEDKGYARYETRNRSKKMANGPPLSQKELEEKRKLQQQAQRSQRHSRRNANRTHHAEQDFEPDEHTSSGASADADGSLDDAPRTSSDIEPEPEPEPEPELEQDQVDGDGKPYDLRQRKEINYAIPPPLEDLPKPPPRHGGAKNGKAPGPGHAKGKARLGWSASGTELGRWMGMPADDSDSDHPTRTPRKHFGGLTPFGTGAVAAGGMLPGDLATGGTPSNLGKIGDASLADADPLGVNQNVTFDEVGGLDDHIHALKEMTLLPLLYPEVFQRFNVTPPRGVLFHGPPGTGKTLMARALAASCRSGGRQIAFFMRKGADCLSKWVGEAERQLRLLFEEARNSQPSIIFFDEIDGLAPVRSSKQDQIHASIVSTLLALMDGMDGRGQVIVIGATNRPDAVDPALRRPGRFDREFYFGLPGLEAREKILGTLTRKWEGWGGAENEELTAKKTLEVKEKILGLAKLTKGYAGADLRALCTEAALNAFQRRYPQVYKSNDRLLLKPETIGVGLRDFMISIKKLVPSSARSSSTAAIPLPSQFVSLLDESLQRVKDVIQRVLPVEKKLSALEEAEFEDNGGEEGALEKEMLSQAMQTLRVYRPRVVIQGAIGMGQEYVGTAALHHLEGYHVQSLELGTLMSDSTRTVEAAIVQLFIEAKRNQPSVIYIPSLVGWCAALTETSRSTVRAMLDTLAPTDPILLLAVVDGRFADLPRDVKAWFGPTKDNRVVIPCPTTSQREAFFEGLMKDIQRPPNQFADGVQRRKRVLEELPIAPPLEPRKPTAAELALQEENDQRILTLLKYRLGPILTELKRKFKRFTKRATEEYNFDFMDEMQNGLDTVTTTAIEVHGGVNGFIDLTAEEANQPAVPNPGAPMNGIVMEQQQIMQQLPPLYDMDLEKMQMDLFKGRYLTPQNFLDDVGKMVHNADVRSYEDLDRLHKAQAMFTAAQVSIQEFDPHLKMECERMARRERQRREERRKGKGKDKGKEKENPNAPPLGARRSARNNGLQPELPLTDPVKLERRLKRVRGGESSGVDSQGSEAEAHGILAAEGGRDAKRSRMLDDDDRDELDTLAIRPGTVNRPHGVRFVASPVRPMAPLVAVSQIDELRPQHQPLPVPSHPSLYPPPNHQIEPAFHDQMVVDSISRRSDGFNPNLLNPLSPSENAFGSASYGTRPNDIAFNFPTTSTDPYDPFISHPQAQHPHPNFPGSQGPDFIDIMGKLPTSPLPPMINSHNPVPEIHIPYNNPSRLSTPLPEVSSSTLAPAPQPMHIHRSPTPVFPEFYVPMSPLSELRELLSATTSGLTVEQLEQLRATSLGTVWRHRKEWDRSELINGLIVDVTEFIEQIRSESEDD